MCGGCNTWVQADDRYLAYQWPKSVPWESWSSNKNDKIHGRNVWTLSISHGCKHDYLGITSDFSENRNTPNKSCMLFQTMHQPQLPLQHQTTYLRYDTMTFLKCYLRSKQYCSMVLSSNCYFYLQGLCTSLNLQLHFQLHRYCCQMITIEQNSAKSSIIYWPCLI